MRHVIQRLMPQLNISYVGRESSAAPASGYMSVHLEEQKKFINQALTLDS